MTRRGAACLLLAIVLSLTGGIALARSSRPVGAAQSTPAATASNPRAPATHQERDGFSPWLQLLISGGMGIAGTIIGAQWSERQAIKREERGLLNDRKSVRTLLRIEASGNLQRLAEFQTQIQTILNDSPGWQDTTDQAFQFAHAAVPAWDHLMWQSQASQLFIALSEEEIIAFHHLHSDLKTITDAQHRLLQMLAADDAAEAAVAPGERQEMRRDFDRWGGDVWRDAEKTIAHALARGNPLSEDIARHEGEAEG